MMNFKLRTTNYQNIQLEFSMMMKAVGYKQKSKMYDKAVQEFLWFLESIEVLDITKIKQKDLVSYYEYLSTRPNLTREGTLSSSSINNHMLAVNILFDYLVESGRIKSRVVLPKRKNENVKPREILTLEEVKHLFDVCQTNRDKAMLSIAYGCGLRRSEIENLNIHEVQLTKGVLIVRNGKFNKRREIPLSDGIINNLKQYVFNERTNFLKVDNLKYEEAFFINNNGKRMSGDSMYLRLKQLVELSNSISIQNKNISLHHLRHSIAVHLLDNNASLEFVKDYLGHSEIDTVHVYSRRRKMKELLTKKITR